MSRTWKRDLSLRCAVIMEKHIDFTKASFQRFKHAIQTSFSKISKERCFGMNVWYTLPAKCRRKQPAWSLHPIIVPIQANVTPAITAMLHFATMSSRDLQSSFCDRSWKTCASSAGIVAGSWNCVRLQLLEYAAASLRQSEYWNYPRDLASDNLMNTFDKLQNPDNSWLLLICIHRWSLKFIETVAHQHYQFLGQFCAATGCGMLQRFWNMYSIVFIICHSHNHSAELAWSALRAVLSSKC